MTFFDPPEARRREPNPARAWLVLAMIVLLAAAAYYALHRVAGDRVPLGTTVEGVSVSGLSPGAARARLARELGPDMSRPLSFVHEDQTYRFDPVPAGVRIDYAATVAAAQGRQSRWSPAGLWNYYTGGRARTAVLRFDPHAFPAAIDRLTAKIGKPAVEGTVDFSHGVARPVYGQTGLAVDRPATEALIGKILFDQHPAELPVSVKQPYVTRAAVQAALTAFARPAMSGPVDLVIGGHRFSAPPRLFGKALRMIPHQGRLVPLLNGDDLVAALHPVLRTLGDKPVNASVTIRAGRPVVVPAVYGASYDTGELAAAFLKALRKPAGQRIARVHAAITDPARTTAQARALNIRARRGVFRVRGGTALAKKLDGALLGPGHTLRLSDRIGGTNAFLGSALFTAALKAGLPIPAYTPVASHLSGLPDGKQMSDLTVAAPSAAGVLVSATPAGTEEVTVTIWSAPGARVRVTTGPHTAPHPAPVKASTSTTCTPSPGRAGYTVKVHRRVGSRASTFTSTYAPVAAVQCTSSASPSPSSSPSG